MGSVVTLSFHASLCTCVHSYTHSDTHMEHAHTHTHTHTHTTVTLGPIPLAVEKKTGEILHFSNALVICSPFPSHSSIL